MVYLQATVQVVPGKLLEVRELIAKEAVPLFEKYGSKLVGSWQTVVGNMEEITDIWAFDSIAHFEQVTKSLGNDPAWWANWRRGRPFISSETTKLLSPIITTELIK